MRAALKQFEQRPILERLQIYSLAMIAIILIARLFDSYTLDETGMVYLLQKPFHDFYHSYTVKFPMLSLYEVMMWGWSRLAGSSEAILRFPSLIFFFGSAVLVFKICERHLVSGTGLATILIFFSMPQVQKFATTARPYALIIFLITAAIFHLFKWWDHKGNKSPNSNRSLYVSGIFLGLACLTKIFCFELVPAFLVLAILGTNKNNLKNIRQSRILVLFLFLAPSILTAMIQFKTALHFQTQSSLHQSPFLPSLHFFLLLQFWKLFPLEFMVISSAGYVLTRPALKLDKKFCFILVVAVLPAILNHIISKLTGSFLISEKYVAGSYTASAMTLGYIYAPANARRLSLAREQWRRVLLAILTAFFGMTSAMSIPAGQEDWRRVIAIANNMYPDSRSEVLLVSSAFFESDHAEFTDDPFVVAPALVYGAKGTLISIPTVAPSAELPWLEELITKHHLDAEEQTIVLIGKQPLLNRAGLIAEILGRGLEGLEINNTVIFLLFKINGLVENSSSANSHDREQP